MRKCYIHIGTHKTGTSALQEMLARHDVALQDKGFLYPRAGRPAPYAGHHNIAWEVTGDHRFQPQHGTIGELVREIDAEPHDVILSSEDFEGAVDRSNKFSEFVRLLQSRGFSVILVVYLKNPVEYLPSIYVELITHGLSETFQEFLLVALCDRSFQFKEWVFQFNYVDWIRRLHEIADVDIIVRAYEHARASITADFLSIIGLTLNDFGIEKDSRIHVTQPIEFYLPIFLENRIGRKLAPAEMLIVDALFAAFVKTERVDISTVAKRKIMETLLDSYRIALKEYHAPESEGATEQSIPKTAFKGFSIDELFSKDVEISICKWARTLAGQKSSDRDLASTAAEL